MKEFDPNYESDNSSVNSNASKRTNAMIEFQKINGKGSWKEASDDDKKKFKVIAKDINDKNGFNGN